MRVTVSPEQIQSAFEAVKDDPSFDESRGLWERGRPPVEMIQAMCLRPEILRGFAGFGGCVYPVDCWSGGSRSWSSSRRRRRTSASSARTRIATWSTSRTSSRIRWSLIESTDSLDPRERIAIAYTRAVMTDSNHIPEPLTRGTPRALHRPRAGRADVPDRLHQHAESVQQRVGRPLQRGVQPAAPASPARARPA